MVFERFTGCIFWNDTLEFCSEVELAVPVPSEAKLWTALILVSVQWARSDLYSLGIENDEPQYYSSFISMPNITRQEANNTISGVHHS